MGKKDGDLEMAMVAGLALLFLGQAAKFHGLGTPKRPSKRPKQQALFSHSPSQQNSGIHRCHAHGCERSTPERHLMCKTHWAGLEPWAKGLINHYYRPGQERDKRPSRQYIMAQRIVILYDAVRRRELSAEEAARGIEAATAAYGRDVFDEVRAHVEWLK